MLILFLYICFVKWLEDNYKELNKIASRYAKSKQDREEAVQELCLQILESPPKELTLAYCTTALRLKLYTERLEVKQKKFIFVEGQEVVEDQPNELITDVKKIINKLPEKHESGLYYQDLFHAIFVEGYSYRKLSKACLVNKFHYANEMRKLKEIVRKELKDV